MRGTVHLPGQGAPITVEIALDMHAVTARAPDGRAWSIALDALTLEPGGFEADFVFCRPPDLAFTIMIRDEAFVSALAQRADPRLERELAKVRAHRRGHHRARWLGIGAVVLILALLAAAVLAVPSALAGSIDALPTSIDRQLGAAADAQVEASGPAVEDPVVTSFVASTVARLAAHAGGDFDFRPRVVDDPQVNAFALPGGRIVVFTGLLRAARSPEQVAGVLAHEMAHVTLRHGLRNVAHRAGLLLAMQLLLGDASQWVQLAGDAAVLAQSNDYSREQESAADAEGVRLMMAAGLDPRGLSGFFRLLEEEPGSELAGPMSWLSTHPDHASRIAHVEELARTLPSGPREPLRVDWAAVQGALPAP